MTLCTGTFAPSECLTATCIYLLSGTSSANEDGTLDHPFTSLGLGVQLALGPSTTIVYFLDQTSTGNYAFMLPIQIHTGKIFTLRPLFDNVYMQLDLSGFNAASFSGSGVFHAMGGDMTIKNIRFFKSLQDIVPIGTIFLIVDDTNCHLRLENIEVTGLLASQFTNFERFQTLFINAVPAIQQFVGSTFTITNVTFSNSNLPIRIGISSSILTITDFTILGAPEPISFDQFVYLESAQNTAISNLKFRNIGASCVSIFVVSSSLDPSTYVTSPTLSISGVEASNFYRYLVTGVNLPGGNVTLKDFHLESISYGIQLLGSEDYPMQAVASNLTFLASYRLDLDLNYVKATVSGITSQNGIMAEPWGKLKEDQEIQGIVTAKCIKVTSSYLTLTSTKFTNIRAQACISSSDSIFTITDASFDNSDLPQVQIDEEIAR